MIADIKTTTSYWWMSFCNADKPKGERFLGGLIIKADSDLEAIKRSHFLELNPGGEVLFYKIPEQYHERIPMDWIETRLISKKECEDLERLYHQ
jgi:hypothetical protein